uniref:B30.2/SPRY domain-containing protein n=1 Tax=Eptatretus burgeri TaxID=7764 RepID=A0A8C4QR26_EPTBU
YMFWVCAVNRAGESLSSTPALYMTGSLCMTCTGMSESEACEKEISLQHNQTYRLFVRSVNNAGCSDRSSTHKHCISSIYPSKLRRNCSNLTPFSLAAIGVIVGIVYNLFSSFDVRCLQVLAEVLPPKGHHYWEVDVHKATCYRLGLAGCSFPCTVPLGEDDDSWCLSCTDNVSRIQFLHLGCITTIYLTVLPLRIGILLDYTSQKICFSNADSGQVLYSLCLPHLKVYAPAFGLQGAGSTQHFSFSTPSHMHLKR